MEIFNYNPSGGGGVTDWGRLIIQLPFDSKKQNEKKKNQLNLKVRNGQKWWPKLPVKKESVKH